MKPPGYVILIVALLTTGCTSSRPPIPSAAPPASEQGAHSALEDFFALLHNGQYAEAVLLYGGPYDTMRDHNPSMPPNDLADLMRNACEINGASCLTARSITLEESPSDGEFHFLVEFQNEDGSPFVRGPCCGASAADQPPQSVFPYIVTRTPAGAFLVMDMPPYVP